MCCVEVSTYRPVVVQVSELVREALEVVWLQASSVMDDVVAGGCDCALADGLAHQEEVKPEKARPITNTARRLERQRKNTFFCRAEALISSQKLLRKLINQGSFESSSSSSVNVKTQYWAPILKHKLVQCVCRNILCTRKTEPALDVKFYLDIHRVYMAMATNTDQL